MVNIIRAQVLGFCMGVRRAVDLTCAEASRLKDAFLVNGKGACFTFGPLIHNPRVLKELAGRGVRVIEELPNDLTGTSLIIRAHGVSPHIEQAAREKGAKVVDATCPLVKASQTKASWLVQNGCNLFLAGEANHAELLGIMGYAPGSITVGNPDEAEAAAGKLHLTNPHAKTALIGQTTIGEDEYAAISRAIQKYFPLLEIMQTICPATKERQESLRHLLGTVEAVIIAGGKESANTRRLFAIAQEAGKPCVLAESPADIPAEFASYQNIGLCAGASTPDSLIDEIERMMKNI